jgi:hypothetical protein
MYQSKISQGLSVLTIIAATCPSLPARAQTQESDSRRPWFNQYSLFQGPSITGPTAYQPGFDGTPDLERPIALRNFSTVGLELGDSRGVAATLAWAMLAGPEGGMLLRDPSLRVYDSALAQAGIFQWHADLRVHFGVGPESRVADRYFSVQTFHALTLQSSTSPWSGGLWLSARWSAYGNQSFGPVWEFFAAPNAQLRIVNGLSLGLALEENAGLWAFDGNPGTYSADPWYLEASLSWQPTPELEISPAVNYPLASEATSRSLAGSIGVSWTLF